jgi:RimJ/RimL family protein N-acetyltransferase
MVNSRVSIVHLDQEDYPDAAEVCRDSTHFLVDLSGENPDRVGLETVIQEVKEAQQYRGIVIAIKLRKNQRMIGISSYIPQGYKGQYSHAWVALMLISEKFHRHGYGTEAYNIIENIIFADKEISKISLAVLTNNPDAFSFWHRMGYLDTGIQKKDSKGHDVSILEKFRT